MLNGIQMIILILLLSLPQVLMAQHLLHRGE